MKPASPVIGGHNRHEVVYAANQPQYIPLPAHKSKEGIVTTRWTLSLKERLQVLLSGNVYLQVMTFNAPLQPLKMMAVPPAIQPAYQKGSYDTK